jgi:hypothetical protein
MTNSTTSTLTGRVAVDDRRLPRGAVAGVGAVGFLLLVVAARTDGYWQGLLINLGTGVLLFVALEQLLYGTVEHVTKLVTQALAAISFEGGMELVRWTDQSSMDELPAVQRELQAIAPLPTDKLEGLQLDLAAIAEMNTDERMKRMSYLSLLADKYGVQPVRQVMASRGRANAG